MGFMGVAIGFWVFSLAARIFSASDPAHSWSQWQRCTVILRFDSLMTGVAAAWLSVSLPEPWRRHRRICAILGGLLVLWMFETQWVFHNGGIAESSDGFFNRTVRFSLFSLGFALLLPWGSEWRLRSENPASWAVRRIALWSYSLYLVHRPWFAFLERLGWGGSPASAARGWETFALQIGGAIALSAIAYRLIEKPFMDRRDQAGKWLRERLNLPILTRTRSGAAP
jgi:peptidoglycan/LPS O-acetylase OafA/YrhL